MMSGVRKYMLANNASKMLFCCHQMTVSCQCTIAYLYAGIDYMLTILYLVVEVENTIGNLAFREV